MRHFPCDPPPNFPHRLKHTKFPSMLSLLLGNSFPLSLVRRRGVIDPRPLGELRALIVERGLVSFWGHENTLVAAGEVLGCDLTPRTTRPVIELDARCYPQFEGVTYREVWLLSPDFRPGFRPRIAEEVPAMEILAWQALHLTFPETSNS